MTLTFLAAEEVTTGGNHRHVRFGDRIEVLTWPCHACVRVDDEYFIFASGVLLSGSPRSEFAYTSYARGVASAVDAWSESRGVLAPDDLAVLQRAIETELLDVPPSDVEDARGRLAAFVCPLPNGGLFRFKNAWSWDLSGPNVRYETAVVAAEHVMERGASQDSPHTT